jgi:hypothetical protein
LEQPPLNLTPEELQEPRLDDIQEERSSQIAPGEIPDMETVRNEQVRIMFREFFLKLWIKLYFNMTV